MMTRREMRRLVLEHADVKATGSGRAYTELTGLASTFGNVDRGGDVVVKGAFRKTIREAVKRGNVPLMDGHEHRTVRGIIGTVRQAKETDEGLVITAELSETGRAQQIARLVNEGHAKKMSIGYQVVKAHQGTVDNEPVTYLDEVKLLEVSVVGIPMNDQAEIVGVKDSGGDQPEPTGDATVESDLRAIAAISNREARYAAFDHLAKNLPAAPADGPDSTGAEAASEPDTEPEGTSETKTETDGHSYALEFLGLSKSEPADGSLGGESETGPAADALAKGDALLAVSAAQESEQLYRELLNER